MAKKKDWVGKKFGRLTVIEDLGRISGGARKLRCKCDCGNIVEVQANNLTSGNTTSCECARTKHKGSYDPLYPIHQSMMYRCYNPKCEAYPRYGARGIKVCDDWHNCTNFYKWAYANGYEPGLTLERIDVNGDYCPENCCWATDEEQANNRRNNIKLTINGKTQTLKQHTQDPEINVHKLSYKTVWTRYRTLKWPKERLFSASEGGKRNNPEVL